MVSAIIYEFLLKILYI